MKKLTSLVLVITIVISTLTAFAVSASAVDVGSIPEEYFTYAEGIAAAAAVNAADYKFPDGATVYSSDLNTVMSVAYYTHPELFNLSTEFQYGYKNDAATGKRLVTRVIFKYLLDADEYAAAKIEVNKWAEGVLSLTDSSYTELDYIIFFHDYLSANYAYDTNYESRSVYSLIKTGVGVCQAYTYAYAYLLNLVGVENSYASSAEMNHIWNLVKLDGEWYHVDVTWDDPVGNMPGKANHGYFILSDTMISSAEKSHIGWISPHACSSDKYDGAKFGEAESVMAKTGGYWYFVKDGDLYRSQTPENGGELFMELDLVWHAWQSTAFYIGSFSSLVALNGMLYLSTPTQILEIDPATKTSSALYTYTGSDGYIYGFTADMGEDSVSGAGYADGNIILNISKAPGTAGTEVKVCLFASTGPVKGDADGNGRLNISDVVITLKYIAKWENISVDTVLADYDGDGKINIIDVSFMMKKIAGWNV